MTTSESKDRFFNETNRFESISITNRVDSNRELECSSRDWHWHILTLGVTGSTRSPNPNLNANHSLIFWLRTTHRAYPGPATDYIAAHFGGNRERKCADTIDTVQGWPFPMLKYKYIFQIKIQKQFYQTALENCYGLKYQKRWLQFKKIFYYVIYYNFRHTFVP